MGRVNGWGCGMSKIHGLAIVTQQGVSAYYVGSEYRGLTLHVIKDYTVAEDGIHVPHYIGFTEDKQTVFEAINAPIEITYCAD
jgi:nitrogen regulatory protein PII-like uncharacterized protein